MPLILPGNVGSATAATGFNVDNSCMFDNAGNDSLTRSKGASETSVRTATYSFWIKRAEAVGTSMWIYSNETTSGSNRGYIEIDENSNFRILVAEGSDNQIYFITDAEFRDFSAWSHWVISIDTTQATEANRVKIYLNGVQVTSFSTATYPGRNADLTILVGGQTNKEHIGNIHGETAKLSAYLCEFVFIDGLQLAADQFGEFDDSGIWKPIDPSGLTFGNEGFYLNFQTAAELGDDVSGNTNDFSENNLTAVNQSTDTCTNNFATMNPLDNFFAGSTFAEGNCKLTYLAGTGKYSYNTGTIALTSGKWYHEVKIAQSVGSNYNMFGIEEDVCQSTGHEFLSSSTGYVLNGNNGKIIVTGTDTTYGDATAVNDIIGVYVDLDNNKIYFAENGTVMNSGTGQTIAAVSATKYGYYFVIGGDYSSGTVGIHEFNFGGSPAFTISSGNTDDNGYGNFEYSPNITGDSVAKKFYAICTKNLAEYG